MDDSSDCDSIPARLSTASVISSRSINASESALRRRVTVYEAVEGTLTSTTPSQFVSSMLTYSGQVLNAHAFSSRRRDRTGSEKARTRRPDYRLPAGPNDILFEDCTGADTLSRAEFEGHVNPEQNLPAGGQGVLPDSNLLQAIHTYTSKFYAYTGLGTPKDDRKVYIKGVKMLNEESMDETALLAFGILLEEASREALGKTGDLVFTDGQGLSEKEMEEDADSEDDAESKQVQDQLVDDGTEATDERQPTKPRKRRRIGGKK
jgi:hypothetical protein